jgi:LPS-assembly protein
MPRFQRRLAARIAPVFLCALLASGQGYGQVLTGPAGDDGQPYTPILTAPDSAYPPPVIVAQTESVPQSPPPPAARPPAPENKKGKDKIDPNAPVDFTADSLSHDEDGQVITASGHVELSQAGRIVRADTIVYNMKTDTITARGHVVLDEPNGDVHFADEVELSNKLRDGFVRGMQSYLANGGHFTAAEGRRTGGTLLTMNDATYTPCDCETDEKGDPAWQLKAKKVTYDQTAHRVSYRDATFDLFGVPLAWTPYLSHPDGKIKQKSGFMVPKFGYNSRLGAIVSEGYYMALAPDHDATVGTMLTTEKAPVLLGQYRQRWAQAELKVDGSGTSSDRADSIGGKTVQTDDEFRGHLFAEGRWDMTDTWRSGVNLELTTDDQYLREYNFSSKDVLENQIYAERFSGRDYADVRLIAFQDVRVQEEQTDQPNVLPEVTAEFVGDPNGMFGGRWKLDTSALGLERSSGQDMTRFVTTADWQRRFISDMGIVSTLDLSARGDAYAVQDRDIPAGSSLKDSGTAGRFLPQAHLVNSLPFAKPLEKAQVVVEPLVALTVAPNINAADPDIPNEDSQDVQVDASNLFNADRFPGEDKIEDGSRVTYGVRTGLYGYGGSYGDVFFGQSYNLSNAHNPFPQGSGLENQRSDYVGQVAGVYDGRYGIDYRFQLSSESMASTRHELDAYGNFGRLDLSTRYLFAKGLEGTDIDESRQQLGVGAGYRMTEHWRVRGTTLYDLGQEPGLRQATLGLDYFGCCLSFSVNAERNLTSDVSGDSGTDVMFRLGLKGLGEFQTEDTGGGPLSYRD